MKKLLLFISTVLLFWSCTTSPPHKSDYYDLLDQSYPNQRFEKIDRAVLNLEKEDEESIASLVKAIENFAQTDWEKTRAVYVWITHNIEYDKKGLNSGDKASCKAKDVIKNRTCVCAGYANLFTALSKGLDLEAQDISGYAKGVSYREGKRPSGTNHAWNIVYIDGEAHLFDATWGAGNAQGKRRWVFDYDEFYFDTKPEEFIFSHFPKNEEYQLLDNPLTRDEFFNLPQLRSNAFNVGLTSEGLITRARKGEIVRTPTIYS